MNDIFEKSEWMTYRPSNIKAHSHNTVRNFYNSKRLKSTIHERYISEN